jgi:hypothetical protein
MLQPCFIPVPVGSPPVSSTARQFLYEMIVGGFEILAFFKRAINVQLAVFKVVCSNRLVKSSRAKQVKTARKPSGLVSAAAQSSTPSTTMATDTNVSVVITPDQKAAILAKIADLNAAMSFLIGLTDDQRKKMLKMGDKTVGFEQKCASYMASRPDLVPSFVDVNQLSQDRAAWADVADILRALLDAYQRVDDTDMVLAHQIYLPDLSFYQNVQMAAKRNVPGAQAIYDDLKARFPGHPHTTPVNPLNTGAKA